MIRTFIASSLIAVSFMLAPILLPIGQTVSAASAGSCQSQSNFLGFPTWYKYLNPHFEDDDCKLDFNFPQDIGKVLLALIEILLRVAAIVALVFVIVGAVRYTTSQGQPEATAAARKTILNALIGLVIAVSAVAIVSFIGGRFK